MNKARQCIIKAAALRAQADNLEEVALLADQDADSGYSWAPTVAKALLGLGALGGAGTLGLAKGRELGLAKGHELGLAKGRELGLAEAPALNLAKGRKLGFAEGSELAFRQQGLQRAADLKAVRKAALKSALTTVGVTGVSTALAGLNPAAAGILALATGILSGTLAHSGVSATNQIKDYRALKKLGLW